MPPPPPPGQPARTDVRFDFVNKLPSSVPPIEQQPTSFFPFPPPVGPAEATYYFPIPVMPTGPNATGVFFPAGYGFPDKLNVILYFHGHKAGEFKTINEYWGGQVHNIRLREDINATGKPAVLIAPTMGANPGSSLNSDMGIFANAGSGDSFLAEVAKWIGKYVPQYADKKRNPVIGNVVLAGHSGAGGILSQQVKSMRSRICEVWGFDSMYSEGFRKVMVKGKEKSEVINVVDEWLDSAIAFSNASVRPTAKFYFYWVAPEDPIKGRVLDLQAKVRQKGLQNVTIIESATVGGSKYGWENHFGTVTANFRIRVDAANCF